MSSSPPSTTTQTQHEKCLRPNLGETLIVHNKQPYSELFAAHCSNYVLDTTTTVLEMSRNPHHGGARSSIHYGVYGGLPVRIKLWRGSPMTHSKKEEFYIELGKGLQQWKQLLGRPNIAPFCGLLDGPRWDSMPSLVMASYPNGNVMQYLEKNPQAKANVLEMLHSIVDNLAYMHSLDPPAVHGGLRSSNILIADDGSAHLTAPCIQLLPYADGLALQDDPDHTRWMAPELIFPPPELQGLNNASTKETDVYAFGMLMFELYGLCKPWPDLANKAVIVKAVNFEKRPARPVCAMTDDEELADHMWKLIQQCWASDPERRPTMQNVQSSLHALWLKSSLRKKSV